MPKIRMKISPKGVTRFSDWTCDPGPASKGVKAEGCDVVSDWGLYEPTEEVEPPPITVAQSEIMRDLLVDCGLTLEIAEDGTVTRIED